MQVPRFSLLQLETGERLLTDVAVMHTPTSPAAHHPLPHVKGRLRICTASLVFEPGTNDLPLLRFPLSKITCIEPVKVQPGWSHSSGGSDARFRVQCSSLISLFAHNKPGPYQYHNGEQEHTFTALHSTLQSFMPALMQLLAASSLPRDQAADAVDQLVREHEQAYRFDPSHLIEGLQERILGQFRVGMLVPLLQMSGQLVVSDRHLYVQLFNSLAPKKVQAVRLERITRLRARTHCHAPVALLISFSSKLSTFAALAPVSLSAQLAHSSKDSLLVVCASEAERDDLARLLLMSRRAVGVFDDAGEMLSCAQEESEAAALAARWRVRDLSNYEYLLRLNDLAGRSFQDISQYPVMPWVISDYFSVTLDLDDPRSYRDLSKPVGALSGPRLEALRQRAAHLTAAGAAGAGIKDAVALDCAGATAPFLYGTHYSTPGYVAHFLVRQAPDLLLHLQSGKFDAADRCFASVAATWRSVHDNAADFKELIPEFFGRDPGFLVNDAHLDLGLKQNGVPVGDVELPVWADDADHFLALHRQALESDHVSAHLHEWIDLIFGHKARGAAAVEADNLFYPLTYPDVFQQELAAAADPLARDALRLQAQEFGQSARQLFAAPHPPRDPTPAAASQPGAEHGVAVRAGGSEDGELKTALHPGPDPAHRSVEDSDRRGEAARGEASTLHWADRSAARWSPPPDATAPASSQTDTHCFVKPGFASGPDAVPLEGLALDAAPSSAPPTVTQPRVPGVGGIGVCVSGAVVEEDAEDLVFPGLGGEGGESDAVAVPMQVRGIPSQRESHTELAERQDGQEESGWQRVNAWPALAPMSPWTTVKAKDAVMALAWIDTEIGGGGCREGRTHSDANLGSMVTAAADSTVRVVSVAAGAQTRCWSISDLALSSAEPLPASCVAGGAGGVAGLGGERDRAVAVGSWDGCVYVVSLEYGRIVQALRSAHEDAVSALAFCSHKGLLLSGSWDGSVKAWGKTESGLTATPLASLAELDTEVRDLCALQDGSVCSTLGADDSISLWDVRSCAAVYAHAPGGTAMQLLSHLTGGTPLLAVATRDAPSPIVELWDLRKMAAPCCEAAADIPLCSLSALNTDGNAWVAGTTDGELMMGAWGGDGDRSFARCQPRQHSDVISACQVVSLEAKHKAADGRGQMLLLSASQDASACVWGQ